MRAVDRRVNFRTHRSGPSHVVLHDQGPVLLARAQVRTPPVQKGLGPGRRGLATGPLSLQALQLRINDLVRDLVGATISDYNDPRDDVGTKLFHEGTFRVER